VVVLYLGEALSKKVEYKGIPALGGVFLGPVFEVVGPAICETMLALLII
jgi:hypothetical protein